MKSVWTEFLQQKKDSGERCKIYLNEKSTIFQYDNSGNVEQVKLNNIMLSGVIDNFDESTVRLKNRECLIERPNIMTIKSDNGGG